MPRISLALAAAALAALAFVPPAGAIPEPQVPCYPDFYGGTVCVLGEEPAPCFAIVAYNPDPRHPAYPVGVSPVSCREADGGATQMTPCLPADPEVLGLNGPYC
jgi:hypothetical protein